MAASNPLRAEVIETPLGKMEGVIDCAGAVVYLDFREKTGPTPRPGASAWRGCALSWSRGALDAVSEQLAQYFDGSRQRFDINLSLDGPPLHLAVWMALLEIRFGSTLTYKELAARLGRPEAARAVGRANGANPISILIPCHRVVGSDGRLTGYSGGLERKQALLALERGSPFAFDRVRV